MALSHSDISRSARGTEAALWMAATLIVLSAHIGVSAWLMRERPLVAADDVPSAAIMIEFADEAEAVNIEMNDVTPDQQSAAAVEPVEGPEEVPPEEIIETPPDPAEPEFKLEDEAGPVEEIATLPDAEVPLPIFRPKPPEPKKEVVRREETQQPKPVRQRPRQIASNSAVQAQAQVTRSNRNAARQNASGASSISPAKWQSRLMAHLERRKRYPAGSRQRREQGTVYVRFHLDDDGNVLSVALARSSGFSELDNEVLALVRRASPVPAPPEGVNRTITAPVQFNLR